MLMAQFSIYVHKGGTKPHSFHFIHAESTATSLYYVEAGKITILVVIVCPIKGTQMLNDLNSGGYRWHESETNLRAHGSNIPKYFY